MQRGAAGSAPKISAWKARRGLEEAPVLAAAAGRMLLSRQQCADAGMVSPTFLLNLPLVISVQPAVPLPLTPKQCGSSHPISRLGGRGRQKYRGLHNSQGQCSVNWAINIQLQKKKAPGARFAQHTSTGLFLSQDFFLQLSTNSSFCLRCRSYVIIKRNPSPREQAGSQALPAGVPAHYCPTLSKQVLLCEFTRQPSGPSEWQESWRIFYRL